MRRGLVLAVIALLALAPAARAGGPGLELGAAEDAVRSPTLAGAKAQLDLLVLAGFRSVRITQVWKPGDRKLDAADTAILRSVAAAAHLDAVDVIVSVLNFGSRTTPLTDDDQRDFAAYAASIPRTVPLVRRIVVGNEPNLNRYWLPQFNEDGSDAAAPAYESLLARTYDALKAVSPKIQVLGGAVSPRGADEFPSPRHTHSPTTFIRDLGAAYRDSGRTKPIMDAFAFHPYEDNSSVAPVDGTHPRTTTIAIADYDKLVALLGEAFDGTAQRGSTLPILYDEFGVESQIPAAKAALYTGREPATTKPVPERTQADYYRQAIALAFCQPNVDGLFLFHARDESDLDRWQSGVYYANGTPKTSLAPVRTALDEARRGVIARCPGMQLKPRVTLEDARGNAVVVGCDIDCAGEARLLRRGKLVARKPLRVVGGRTRSVSFKAKPGLYRILVRVRAPVNPGPIVALSRPVRSTP